MISNRPASVYRPTGDVYTRIDNGIQFKSNGEQAFENQLDLN